MIHDAPKVVASYVAQRWADQVELLLITEIEKIEGRVPSNEEVSRYGHCRRHHDGEREYQWKDRTILRIDSWRLDEDMKFVLNYSLPKQ